MDVKEFGRKFPTIWYDEDVWNLASNIHGGCGVRITQSGQRLVLPGSIRFSVGRGFRVQECNGGQELSWVDYVWFESRWIKFGISSVSVDVFSRKSSYTEVDYVLERARRTD